MCDRLANVEAIPTMHVLLATKLFLCDKEETAQLRILQGGSPCECSHNAFTACIFNHSVPIWKPALLQVLQALHGDQQYSFVPPFCHPTYHIHFLLLNDTMQKYGTCRHTQPASLHRHPNTIFAISQRSLRESTAACRHNTGKQRV